MDMRSATKSFERWLTPKTKIITGDLRHKHTAMGADPFSFLRATYYRWAQQFAELDVAQAPKVLAVGDLHIENFGTWRDGIGRLAWGINDFDEAYPLPFTNDLVRTATSVLLAVQQNHLGLKPKAACKALLDGYRQGIAAGGRPFVIGEDHRWFKPILQSPQHDPGLFWDKLRSLPLEKSPPPAPAKSAIIAMLPDPRLKFQVHHRVAGLGNLGKPRYTAIADWLGGPVCREVKAVTLSSAAWASSKSDGPYYADIVTNAVRCADPYLQSHGPWVTRRLSPDCRRLELAALARVKDEEWLLHAMGFETANIHLGTKGAARSIARHLKVAPRGWLREAAVVMEKRLLQDFRTCKKGS